MPINGLWTIRMAVTRRLPEDTAGESAVLPSKNASDNSAKTSGPSGGNGGGIEEFDHDPTDWVSVRMGPSLTTLHHVADIKNIVNDDLGEVKCVYPAGNQLKYSLVTRGEGPSEEGNKKWMTREKNNRRMPNDFRFLFCSRGRYHVQIHSFASLDVELHQP